VIPFSLDPQLRGAAHTLFTTGDAVGLTEFSMFVARKPFIDKNRAALVDFMEDTLRIVRWYLDPANHQQVMEICARLTRQPVDRFGWVFTKQDNYRDPNMLPDLAALQRNVDTMKDLGYVKARVDVKAHADLSIIEEAAKRLK
jgi:NitT/TauT family transport system substrate-binding protein